MSRRTPENAYELSNAGLQDVVGPPKLEVLLAQPLQLGLLLGRETGAIAGVDLGLLHPGTQGFVPDPELSGHPGDNRLVAGILCSELLDHLHGPLLQLRRVAPRRRLV